MLIPNLIGAINMAQSITNCEGNVKQVYHASEVEVAEPRWDYAEAVMQKPGAKLKDFGLGFYTCTDMSYPLKLASAKNTLVLNKYSIDLGGLKCIKLSLDMEWLLTIAFHRRDLESRKWCHGIRDRCRKWIENSDVVIGVISNDKTYRAIEGFLDNNWTDTVAISMINAAEYGEQYAFKSQLACNRLKEGFKGSAAQNNEQIKKYRDVFREEVQEYNSSAERLRMDLMKSGNGDFLEDILRKGLFDGKVRF